MEEIDVDVKRFDPKTIPYNSVILMLGMRNSGKSSCIRDILFHHKDIPKATVISGTEGPNPFFKKFMPLNFINTNVDESIIQDALKRQEVIKESKDALVSSDNPVLREKSKKIDTRAILILDDCVGKNNKIFRTNPVKEMFMNGKHFDMLFIIALQYATSIHPDLRQNINYIFLFAEPRRVERERIYRNYASAIPSFELFNFLMDEYTNNYGCLVIKITNSTNLGDSIFRYKGNLHTPQFKIGAPIYWKGDKELRDKLHARALVKAERVLNALELADVNMLDSHKTSGSNAKRHKLKKNTEYRINSVD